MGARRAVAGGPPRRHPLGRYDPASCPPPQPSIPAAMLLDRPSERDHPPAPAPADGAALRVRGLRKRYGDVVAVDGLELEVRTGECFGLLGPNGAGKTTTLEICEGLTVPDEGDVVVLGRRWASDGRALRERLGIQLQETQLAEKLTVEETVRLFRSFYRAGREVGELVALVQLEE